MLLTAFWRDKKTLPASYMRSFVKGHRNRCGHKTYQELMRRVWKTHKILGEVNERDQKLTLSSVDTWKLLRTTKYNHNNQEPLRLLLIVDVCSHPCSHPCWGGAMTWITIRYRKPFKVEVLPHIVALCDFGSQSKSGQSPVQSTSRCCECFRPDLKECKLSRCVIILGLWPVWTLNLGPSPNLTMRRCFMCLAYLGTQNNAASYRNWW